METKNTEERKRKMTETMSNPVGNKFNPFMTKYKNETKRRSFTMMEKWKVLQELENLSIQAVCKKYNLNHTVLDYWIKKKESIRKASERSASCNLKRLKSVENAEIDERVYSWFLQMRTEGIPVSGPMVQKMALQIRDEIGKNPHFTASNGWLQKWKQRKGIPTFIISSEQQSADTTVSDEYNMEFVESMESSRYQDFFNGTLSQNEQLPINALAQKYERQGSEWKSLVERDMIASCSSADSSCEPTLVVTGKHSLTVTENWKLKLEKEIKETIEKNKQELKGKIIDLRQQISERELELSAKRKELAELEQVFHELSIGDNTRKEDDENDLELMIKVIKRVTKEKKDEEQRIRVEEQVIEEDSTFVLEEVIIGCQIKEEKD